MTGLLFASCAAAFIVFEAFLFAVAWFGRHADEAQRRERTKPLALRRYLSAGQAAFRVFMAAALLAATAFLHVSVLGGLLNSSSNGGATLGSESVAALAATSTVPAAVCVMLRRYKSDIVFYVSIGAATGTTYTSFLALAGLDWRLQLVGFYLASGFLLAGLVYEHSRRPPSVWLWQEAAWSQSLFPKSWGRLAGKLRRTRDVPPRAE